MRFDELAHQSKACDGSAACAVCAHVLVIDGFAAMLARADEVIE